MPTCTRCGENKPFPYHSTQRCRECINSGQAHARNRLRAEMIVAYGGVCACCGEDRMQFLTIDHIHGEGRRDRKQRLGYAEGGAPYWGYLRRNGWPQRDELQILCYNCNFAKRANEVCPHMTDTPTAAEFLDAWRPLPRIGIAHRGKNNPSGAKLSEADVRKIRKLNAAGHSTHRLARKFGVSQHTIQGIVTRKKWAWVE